MSYIKVTLSKSNILKGIKVVIALGIHLFPFRTEKLSPTTSMVLRKSGRVDSRRFSKRELKGRRSSFERVDSFFCFILPDNINLLLIARIK